ncbi:HipA family kinase [Nocardioides yefusunii]|uniref:HipA family kinase n=1 Tax=Nocardioides yefusunii TaxID=2500546 RepID=A0ABW1QS32_9ACTN|nr:HipA family kinase [Nocardioides yefusunii]
MTRYVTPLREGGSLPGIVEADDSGTYVIKFVGAGQGVRVLVAEMIASGLAMRLGLRTPRLVALQLGAEIARYEADEEVQDLLQASIGLNLGVDYLPGSFGFDGDVDADPDECGTILWLDAFCANVDRSWRNPNLLVWRDEVWVIDHGASLYFHHAWSRSITDPARFAVQKWDVTDHVLERHVDRVPAADERARAVLSRQVFTEIVAEIPDVWLTSTPDVTPDELRAAYVDFLDARLAQRVWLPGGAA